MLRKHAARVVHRIKGKRRNASPALRKAIAVIEAVIEHRITNIPDLAAALRLPRQTVHRSVKQMVESGLLRRETQRERYTAGPRLVELARNTLLRSYREGPAHAVLESVVAATGETCNLGMLDGIGIIYVDRVESKWPLRIRLEQGTHVPFHSTAIGKVLVANLPPPARRRLIMSAPLARFTPRTIVDPKKLEVEFQAIRRRGFAINDQESALGILGVAVPVYDDNGQVTAALALSAPSARVDGTAGRLLTSILRKAARRLSELERLR
jgi:IclR family acetate operon transcriptional repressor